MCRLPIREGEPVAGLAVPMARTDDAAEEWVPGMHPGYTVRQFDVCIGCATGLLTLKPSERRAIEEGVERAIRNHRWSR
jgi:hypothetical protein